MITRDDWNSYAREARKEEPLTGKIFTQRIEHNNLTLRTRIKRLARLANHLLLTLCRTTPVIAASIEKYMFY
ncbi:IS1 family transposase [Affinibrenneria salicis]|uniref:IS1 family transposase n=1 Tax=Affinibrenneria salicis TaxID=2590031 RepID=UPI0021DF9A7E|nr:IS1 family transposase [Affinibrenneria salicis]